MNPISLKINGLYSYQKEQTIDFTSLTNAGIFGIFGSVGSGKSSIIEAIILALYGQTDRLIKANRAYNLMNLKSDELNIEFIFSNGATDQQYKFTVYAKRNRNDFLKISKFERSAYERKETEWKPIEVSKTDNILGLSYENFKRTVVIPQGQFMEFLQLGSKDRTKMLKEIFNLDKYELYNQIAFIDKENEKVKHNLLGKIEQLGEIQKEDIADQKSKTDALELHIEKQRSAHLELKRNLEKQTSLNELHNETTNLTNKLNDLNSEKEYILESQEKLKQYTNCHLHYHEKISFLQNIDKKLASILKESKETLSLIHKQEAELKSKESSFTNAEKTLLQKEQALEEINDRKNIIILQEAESVIEKNKDRIQKGNAYLNNVRTDIELKQKEIKDLQAKHVKLKETTPNLDKLYEDKNIFSKVNAIQTTIETTKKELLTGEKEVSILKTRIKKHKDEFAQKFNFDTDNVDSFLSTQKQKLQTLTDQYNENSVSMKFAAISEELEDGVPCPVCGSTNHPRKYSSDKIHSIALELKEKITKSQKDIEAIQLKFQELNQIQTEKNLIEKQTTLLSDKLHSLTIDRNITLGNTQYTSESTLNKDIESAKRHIENTESCAKLIDEINAQLQLFFEKEKKYTNEIQKIKDDVLKAEINKNTAKAQIKSPNSSSLISKSTIELNDEITKISNIIKIAEENYTQLKPVIEQSRTLIAEHKGRYENIASQIEQLKKDKTGLVNQIGELLSKDNLSSIETVQTILEWEINIEEQQMLIDNFYKELHHITATIKNNEALLQKNKFSLENYSKIKLEYESIDSELNKETELFISEKNKYNILIEQQKQSKQLHCDLKYRENRSANIKLLKDLFRASGFVNYVSTVYLHNICLAANNRFLKLTNNQLSLEIDETNEFIIRDILNNGKTRSVKTLSGGQTFQVALCLALALGEAIPQAAINKQNFFFIDEGFGSLDKESLHTVFDTLQTISKEGKIVGIISHVETLQEDIVSYIKIKKGENGSIFTN